MANPEHLARLKRGVEEWNCWREESDETPDLSWIDLSDTFLHGINFSGAKLWGASFSFADLSGTNLRKANLSDTDLSFADLSGADLSFADLTRADLTSADLCDASLSSADICEANLSNANLSDVNLSNAVLMEANLNNAILCRAYLASADISYASLTGADFSSADLTHVQVLASDFSAATLTGACIEDWHINSRTCLENVVCDFIFFKGYNDREEREEFSDRRPHDPNSIFAPGEFTALMQKSLETVDLIFLDGIDWKAFLASLEDLQIQYGKELNIQGIERKFGGTVLIRLEVPPESDKGIIERAAKEGYEIKSQIKDAQYRAELQELKIQHREEIIAFYKQHNADMMEIIKRLADKPISVEAKAVAENNQAPKYNMPNAKIGSFVDTAEAGSHIQSIQHNYAPEHGLNVDEIIRLITSLREQAQEFPQEKRDDALDHINALEQDIQQPEKCQPKRMKARLAALLAIAVALGGAVATTTDFANNVLELSKKLNIELVQAQSSSPSQPSMNP